MSNCNGQEGESMSESVDVQEKVQLFFTTPKMYAIIIHNDDVTPYEIVVDLLIKVFCKPKKDAIDITERIHNIGKEVVLKSTYAYVQRKADDAMDFATHCGYPNLKIEIEEE